jgi:uncharacterized membrane protein YfcA
MLSPAQHAAVTAVAMLGGVFNSIAGGGMLLTFPALIGLGVPSLVANATSTVALWPASVSSFIGYRAEFASIRAWAWHFAAPSVLGGLVGGVLLTVTSQHRFDQIVPLLVLFATLLFVLQRPVLDALHRRIGYRAPSALHVTTKSPPRVFLAAHFVVAVYGGYFGGGAGMLMLATFGLMGLTNIHQMNGLKNFCGITFNLVAMVAFAVKGLVDWPIALNMALGAAVGGWVGSGLAQRVPQLWVRAAVGVIGFGSGIWLLAARF